VRQNFLSGVVDDNPLGSGATTLTSSALAGLVAVGSTQHLALILDPGASAGAPEIVYVTAHTASATTATILRAQEGTSARSHAQNIQWIHGPTKQDFAAPPVVLGHTTYDPGSVTTKTTTGTTNFVDADSTNLTVTFVAPESGQVRVVLESPTDIGIAGNYVSWNLRDGGGDIAGTQRAMHRTDQTVHLVANILVTGLTNGTSYTWKWGIATSVSGDTARLVIGGGIWGPAEMTVWSA
jgi:hypothetical protein